MACHNNDSKLVKFTIVYSLNKLYEEIINIIHFQVFFNIQNSIHKISNKVQ